MAVSPDLRKSFEDALRSTGREGVEGVLEFLSGTDFYAAPASAGHHGSREGGLLVHSLLTLNAGLLIKRALESQDASLSSVPEQSIVIACLLHDVCDAGFFMQTTRNSQDPSTGIWSRVLCYKVSDSFPLGHGEKSLALILSKGMSLTPDEMLAIRWHREAPAAGSASVEERCSYAQAAEECPLLTIVQMADMSAKFLFERSPRQPVPGTK